MFDFIINPIAGGKNGEKMLKNLILIENHLKSRGVDYKFHFTKEKRQAESLTTELINGGATDIVCVGGDGTLHEVLNGFTNFEKVNLGLIPCGTGNDFAASIGLPLNVVDAVNVIIDGTPKFTDYMQMPTVRGINIIGMGIDVEVLKKYNNLKKKNKMGYTKCLVKTLLKFDYSDFDAIMEGKSTHYRSFIACVANGYRYGGGIPICPVADPTDNKMDFLAVKEMRKLKIVTTFLKLKKGKIMNVKETCHQTTDSIEIKTKNPVTVNVDGELYENIPFKVDLIKNTLKMYR